MIRIIDIFIFKLFSMYFLITLGNIIFIIFVHEVVRLLPESINLIGIAKQAIQAIPTTIELVAPYTGLLSAMLTFGALNKHSEIISMRSAGLSQLQIIRSIFVGAILIVIGLYYNQSYLVRLLNAETKSISFSSIPNTQNWYKTEDKIVKIESPQFAFRNIESIFMIKYNLDKSDIELSNYDNINFINDNWIASKAKVDSFNDNLASYVNYENYEIDEFEVGQLLNSPASPSIYQTMVQLYDSFNNTKRGENVSRLSLLFLLRKINYIIGCMLLIFLSVAFSDSNPRLKSNIARIITVTIIFYFYWFLDQSLYLLTKNNIIDVFTGAFSANTLLLLLILYFIKSKKTI